MLDPEVNSSVESATYDATSTLFRVEQCTAKALDAAQTAALNSHDYSGAWKPVPSYLRTSLSLHPLVSNLSRGSSTPTAPRIIFLRLYALNRPRSVRKTLQRYPTLSSLVLRRNWVRRGCIQQDFTPPPFWEGSTRYHRAAFTTLLLELRRATFNGSPSTLDHRRLRPGTVVSSNACRATLLDGRTWCAMSWYVFATLSKLTHPPKDAADVVFVSTTMSLLPCSYTAIVVQISPQLPHLKCFSS